MEKAIYRIITYILLLTMIFSSSTILFPDSSLAAPLQIPSSGNVQNRINQLKAAFDNGSYFTVNGLACTHGRSNAIASGCTNCKLSSIMTKKLGYSGLQGIADGWTCVAFARFAFWYIFGVPMPGNASSTNVPSGTVSVSIENASPGDLIVWSGHQGIYLGKGTGNKVIVYDCNGTGGIAEVRYSRSPPDFTASNYSYVLHATNYAAINGIITPPPSAPTGLNVVKKTETAVTVSWNAVSGATSYEVQYWRAGMADFKTDPDYTVKNATSYTSTGLREYDTYKYRVRAVNSAGVSVWSEITYTKPVAPTAPSGLKAVKNTDISAIVSWNAVAGATSYEAQYWSMGMADFVTDPDYTVKTSTSYTSTGLRDYDTYKYRVRAVNSLGTSPWSSEFIYVRNTAVPITGVSLNTTSKTMAIGDTYQLIATIVPSNTTDSKALTWVSNNPNVVSVSTNGLITANTEGSVIIYATTSNDFTATCRVTVTEASQPINRVSLNASSLSLAPREKYQLSATIEPSNSTGSKALTWTSSNTTVASVSNNGLVTANATGSAVITVKTDNGKTATCKITVSDTISGDPSTSELLASTVTVRNSKLTVGDKATFTISTGKRATSVALYDRYGVKIASTKKYSTKGSVRNWTITKEMTSAGRFGYYSVACKGSETGDQSDTVEVNVSTASIEAKSIGLSKQYHNVTETLTINVQTSKLASGVSILNSDGSVFATIKKPSRTSGSTKTWTFKRKLTEMDLGKYSLSAQINSKYGKGPQSAAISLTIDDQLSRLISAKPQTTKVKRGDELVFTVVTNFATSSVRITNDKNETWTLTQPTATDSSYLVWEIITTPEKTGVRKFYAQGLADTKPGEKSKAIKISITK